MLDRRIATALALTAAAMTASTAAASPRTAEQIVSELIDRDPLGYGGASADVTMVLVGRAGKKEVRKMQTMSRNDDDTRRIFVRFSSPPEVAGTAFLGVNAAGERKQHLYMPGLAKVRRISGSNRNGRFVGSDYTYADMDYTDLEKSTKKLLPDESIAGQDCHVVEVHPTDAESEYARVVLWVSKESMLPLKARYFDRTDKEIKQLIVGAIKRKDRRWLITESKLVNLARNHTTLIKLVDVTFDDDIPVDQFTVRALDRQ